MDIETWETFLCNRYEPDFNGLHMHIKRLEEITRILKGFRLQVDEKVVLKGVCQATRHWFEELRLMGNTVPAEIEIYLS